MISDPPRSRLIGGVVIAGGLVLYLALIIHSIGSENGVWAIWTVYLLYAVVGGLVLRHSARNPIGLLVAVMGVIPLLGNLAEAVVANGSASGLVGDLATWIAAWYFYVFFGAFVPLFHVFPTGRPMSGMWRWWYRMSLLGSGLVVLFGLFGPPDEGINPFEIPLVSLAAPFTGVVWFALVAGLAAGMSSLAVRFRRSRERERAQLKWFFFSVIVAVFVFFGSAALSEGLGWIPLGLGEALASSAFPLPALGILIAVTRHGLFDIDRIVSRTASYAVVGLVVIAVYVLPVVFLPEVLGLSGDLAVALATLAAAAVFSPVRKRVQRWVDRRFNRERYDAEQVVAGFSGKLQTAVDLSRVTDELGLAVSAALHPTALSVWFGERGLVTVPERPSERMA